MAVERFCGWNANDRSALRSNMISTVESCFSVCIHIATYMQELKSIERKGNKTTASYHFAANMCEPIIREGETGRETNRALIIMDGWM